MGRQESLTLYGIVYLIRNRVNGKVYIGQTTKTPQRRWQAHKYEAKHGVTKHLHQAIRKYGETSFDVVTLHQAFSKEELDEMESCAILSNSSTDPACGYNMTSGGEGLQNPSRAVRQKMSDARKGKPSPRKGVSLSEETRRKISDAKKTTPLSQTQLDAYERRRKPKVAKRTRWASGVDNPFFGRQHCDATKAAWSAKRKGVRPTTETRQNLSAYHKANPTTTQFVKGQLAHNKGKQTSPETREKLRLAHLKQNPSKAALKQREYRARKLAAELKAV
jgi:group I intron endonuclease